MRTIQYQLILLSVAFLGCFSPLFSQNKETWEPCLFDELKSTRSVSNSENIIQSFLAKKKIKQNQKSGLDTIRTIPIVVHIIHNGGTENISLAQINSQIQVLNEDYGKLPGTNGAGNGVDTRVRFCLAKKDPNGNCTDGVIRIKSSLANHQVSERSLLKELSFWNNTRYLNMYVVRSITGNVGGYASFPGGPNGEDGIVVRHNLVGKIGTSTGLGRTATHELGHWFGLYHTFNNGCGIDTCSSGDFVCDTPPQAAPNYNCVTLNTCSNDIPNVVDLKENYMNYTPDSCQDMLTNGQKLRMHATLDTIRTLIWKQSNLIFTGCDSSYIAPASCPVVADFVSLNRLICTGSNVLFMNRSLNNATSFLWTFSGGVPSTSTSQNPLIRYDSIGSFSINLIASNSTNTDTISINNYITVNAPGIGDTLPFHDNFDLGVFPANGITLNNLDSGVTWEIDSQASVSGNYSVKINNLINTNYGSVDEIILPYLDLTTANSNKYLFMSFEWAYAKADPTFSDELLVKISSDCGVSFSQVFYRTQNSLATGPRQTTPFVPTASQWNKANISLSAYKNSDYVQIRIINIPDGGNNLYLDNIYVGDNLGILTNLDSSPEKLNQAKIYPNPANSSISIHFNNGLTSATSVSIYNIRGKLVRRVQLPYNRNDNEYTISTVELENGFYFVNIKNEKKRETLKLVIANQH